MRTASTTRGSRLGVLITWAAAVALVPAFLSTPAQAEPPVNDDIAGAVVVTTTPDVYTVDTTEATADPTDGRHVGDQSVWFRFTSDYAGRFALTTAGSSYNTNLAVFQGSRDSRTLLDWDNNGGPGSSAADSMRIREGQKYWIAISSGGPSPHVGGTAYLRIGKVAEPGLQVSNLQGASGVLSGNLVVTADLTCTTPSTVHVEGRVSQRIDDHVARGYFWFHTLCGPDTPTPMKLVLDSETGWAFSPGTAILNGYWDIWDGISSGHGMFDALQVPVVDDPVGRQAR